MRCNLQASPSISIFAYSTHFMDVFFVMHNEQYKFSALQMFRTVVAWTDATKKLEVLRPFLYSVCPSHCISMCMCSLVSYKVDKKSCILIIKSYILITGAITLLKHANVEWQNN